MVGPQLGLQGSAGPGLTLGGVDKTNCLLPEAMGPDVAISTTWAGGPWRTLPRPQATEDAKNYAAYPQHAGPRPKGVRIAGAALNHRRPCQIPTGLSKDKALAKAPVIANNEGVVNTTWPLLEDGGLVVAPLENGEGRGKAAAGPNYAS